MSARSRFDIAVAHLAENVVRKGKLLRAEHDIDLAVLCLGVEEGGIGYVHTAGTGKDHP